MVRIVLSEEQASQFRRSVGNVRLCSASGDLLGTALLTEEEIIREAKRRLAKKGPRYTSAQVQARLRALEEQWARTGGFDEEYMRAFMERLRQQDPPHA